MANTLKVPGATLYYEIRGAGPTLLLISGGPTDADVYAGIAPLLADAYTVVTYDPRGNSRSTVDGPAEGVGMERHGDDAARLIGAVSDGPANVFGNSGGALTGLNLAARHPERVVTLVAHEPPAVELLPDAATHLARSREVYDTYRTQGVGPAMQKFLALAGLKGGPPRTAQTGQPSPEMIETMARMGRNMELFLGHGMREASTFVPDITALRTGTPRILIACGEASGDQLACRAAAALADRLGSTLLRFPGDHGGFTNHPEAFAVRLREVLAGDEPDS